jgi:hypothetical protein
MRAYRYLKKQSRFPELRFGGGLLAAGYGVYELVQSVPQLRLNGVLLGVVALAYTIWAFRPIAKRYAELEAMCEPAAELMVSNDTPLDVQDAQPDGGVQERRFRVGAVNKSLKLISHLRVVIESTEPHIPGVIWPERPLHPLGQQRDHDGWFDLPRGDGTVTARIEVVQQLRDQKVCCFRPIYDSTSLERLDRCVTGLKAMCFRLRLEGDIPPCSLLVMLTFNEQTGSYEMHEAHDGERVAQSGYAVVQLSRADPTSAVESKT